MEEIIHGYRDDAGLRGSFNRLAKATFDIDFEGWYQNGFWDGRFDPYSLVVEGEVVANVAVDYTDFRVDGQVMPLLQLGTVMTRPDCRKRGYIRRIMEEIDRDFAGRGIYLFANDSVTEFYPKFGFLPGQEYLYSREVENHGPGELEQVPMDTPQAWERLLDTMARNVFFGRCDLVNGRGLVMFYVSKFMQKDVYWHRESGTYVIAEHKGDSAQIHQVFSSTVTDLTTVLGFLGEKTKRVSLGFVPREGDGFTAEPLVEEDTHFFVRGQAAELFHREKLRVPLLARA